MNVALDKVNIFVIVHELEFSKLLVSFLLP